MVIVVDRDGETSEVESYPETNLLLVYGTLKEEEVVKDTLGVEVTKVAEEVSPLVLVRVRIFSHATAYKDVREIIGHDRPTTQCVVYKVPRLEGVVNEILDPYENVPKRMEKAAIETSQGPAYVYIANPEFPPFKEALQKGAIIPNGFYDSKKYLPIIKFDAKLQQKRPSHKYLDYIVGTELVFENAANESIDSSVDPREKLPEILGDLENEKSYVQEIKIGSSVRVVMSFFEDQLGQNNSPELKYAIASTYLEFLRQINKK